jgi:hypothetical protein
VDQEPKIGKILSIEEKTPDTTFPGLPRNLIIYFCAFLSKEEIYLPHNYSFS